MSIPVEDSGLDADFEAKVLEFLRKNKGQAFTYGEIHKAVYDDSKEPPSPASIVKYLKTFL